MMKCERKRSSVLRYYSSTCLEDLRKATKQLAQDSPSPYRASDQGISSYYPGVLGRCMRRPEACPEVWNGICVSRRCKIEKERLVGYIQGGFVFKQGTVCLFGLVSLYRRGWSSDSHYSCYWNRCNVITLKLFDRIGVESGSCETIWFALLHVKLHFHLRCYYCIALHAVGYILVWHTCLSMLPNFI
jgi:hypothetical protein